MKRSLTFVLLSMIALSAAVCAGETVGPAAAVAPNAKDSRYQMWPSAAWSEESKMWLVVWREGDITEQESDIWAARVSADGKALDPAGICVSKAKDVQDRPRAASDGKDFLVVWEDFRNGKDWDVYAGRVSGDGKALDGDGVLVAGGEHNQCRPDAAFASGNYLVAWGGLTGAGVPGEAGTGYVVYGKRLSPEGKILDAAPLAIGPADGKTHTYFPVLAAGGGGKGVVVGSCLRAVNPHPYQWPRLGSAEVNVAEWRVAAPIQLVPLSGGRAATRQLMPMPALAWNGKGFLMAAPPGNDGAGLKSSRHLEGCHSSSAAIYCLDPSGKECKEAEPSIVYGAGDGVKADPRLSLAFDGTNCLLTLDCIRPPPKRGDKIRLEVRGCYLSPEGKSLSPKEGFVIAGDEGKDQMMGSACGGPKGTCLVVYVEPRAADDVKILARVVTGK